MLKYIRILFLTLPFLAILTSCDDDWLFPDHDRDGYDTELAVDFNFEMPSEATRSFEGLDVKTKFTGGEVIHILGTFNTKALQEDGETYVEGKVSRYGALQYNGRTRNWDTVPGNTLKWPNTAVDGTFKAFYVDGSTGVLTTGTPTFSQSLSGITPMSDPLKAQSEEDIPYGHAVGLSFSHICANLMLIDLTPIVSQEYFFVPAADGVLNPETKEPTEFHNGYVLKLGFEPDDKDVMQPTLDFEFIQLPDAYYKEPIFISGQAMIQENIDSEGNTTTTGKVYYFLEPNYYEKFKLTYPSAEGETYDYLTYDYSTIPPNVAGPTTQNIEPNLLENTTYTLAVTKSPGITITLPPSAGGWDDNGNYFDVDVEDFLKAVNGNYDYSTEDPETGQNVQILEKTAEGVKLLHNINFKYFNYSEFKDKSFFPNVNEGVVFDGDYHYIENLGSPLFRYNYGTIKNLGIQEIKFKATSYEAKDVSSDGTSQNDMSRHGAFCMWNRPNATISNIRVKNVEMNIEVRSFINEDSDGSETHNIGCVIGSNSGIVDGVSLTGSFTANVSPYGNNQVNASVLIGGITGQNSSGGLINDVSPLEGNIVIKLNNTCKSLFGSYSIGGIVGESSGVIKDIILSNVQIESSESTGVTSYIGGMAGQLYEASSGTGNTETSLESCIVGGSVKAGVTTQYGYLSSGNYIGGIAGADLNVPVIDCRSAVSVYGTSTAFAGTTYATGGAFGRIRLASSYKFKDLIAYGSVLMAPTNSSDADPIENYVGNFAGLVPVGQTWDTDYAGNGILVHAFGSLNNIGGYKNN